jgi:crotonobetainyl-CoA:carnitine CoA-transferase CaiB-like acyl-CoA transferase
VNRGKRSVTIDLGDPAGAEVARRLALASDIVIESFLPGGADRLDLGYDSLSAARPGLVYTSIAGYSPESVDAHRPGFDFAIQAEAGGMSITGEADGPPLKVGVAIADITTGMFASIGTLAALRDAERTGQGHHVRTSLYDSQLAWLANRGSDWLVAGEEPHRLGNAHPAIVPYEAFATSDGYVIVAIGTNEQYARFCSAAGLPELAADASYATNALRVEHRLELVARLADAIRQRPTADWLQVLETARVPGGPVRTIPEAFAHAPYAIVEHSHPRLGSVRTVRSPIGLDGEYPTAAAAPPLLGQHTAEVLEELGYDDAARAALLAGACRLV